MNALDLNAVARVLGGEVCGEQVLAPSPGYPGIKCAASGNRARRKIASVSWSLDLGHRPVQWYFTQPAVISFCSMAGSLAFIHVTTRT